MYTRLDLKTSILSMVSGEIKDSDLNAIVNRAVREVLSEIDLHSAKRKATLSPDLFDDIYDYAAPIDLKSGGLIDIRPQIRRGRFDEWRLTTEEEFDRLKKDSRVDRWGDPIKISRSEWLGESLVAIGESNLIKKIKISRPVQDTSLTIDDLDSVGSWAGYGDGTNITKDSDNYVKGSACLHWDINANGGTTAGIYNDSLERFDISGYLTAGSIFVWAYIPSPTDIVNFKIKIGSDSFNYYTITITANNEGLAFQEGWNLLRFDLVNKVETGTVNNTACTYVAIYMTKDVLKINETDYRFDWLVIKKGEKYEVIYYSKYGWQSNTGIYLENSTADTDYLNYDTDEIRLIEYKGAELGERHLRNHVEADKLLAQYMAYKTDYQLRHPSEAMVITTTYHFI